ncbi:GAF domain-containing protein [Candidatus Chloroploca sp. Khr17]|uniref:GAF domain-containing protein n=1 Tax=Candidatus Chloroploca sp. Khr17 TaxID=2496869 RepID=UPI00101C41C2|nr:GAF domain-containing protein [Candidatus Chloroploca sp. Khr17]
MDTTLALTSATGWELLAQLAQSMQLQTPVPSADYAGRLVVLLARYLPCSAGRLELCEQGYVVATAAWGAEFAPSEASTLLECRADAELVGQVFLYEHYGVLVEPAFRTALAAQLAFLIASQQRLLTSNQIEQIYEIAAARLKLVGDRDLVTLLQTFLTSVASLLQVEAGAIYTVDADEGRLNLLALGAHELRLTTSLPLSSENLIVQALQGMQVGALTLDLCRTTQASPQDLARPALAVPLKHQDESVGTLVFLLKHAHVAPRLLQAADVCASQVMLLVRNARLLSHQQQRARELFVLYENSQQITGTGQLDGMLARATENIALTLKADICAVHLVEQSPPDTLHTISVYNDDSNHHAERNGRFPTTLKGARFILAQVGRDETMLIEDTQAIAGHNDFAAILATAGCQSALVLTLRGQDQILGLMTLGFKRPRHPVSPTDRNLAQVLAAQVATAILNRRLYLAAQQRATELELLQSISQKLAAELSLEETIEAILAGAKELARFNGARITLVDQRAQALRISAQWGLDEALAAAELTTWLSRHQRALRISDLALLPPQLRDLHLSGAVKLADQVPARSYLGVPLRLREELLGTCELFAVQPGAFTEDDARLLTIVAGYAAQAIANASRYEHADTSLQARIEQLRALQRVSSQLASTLDQKEILQYVLDQALKVTRASHGLIALRNTADDETAEHALLLDTLGLGDQQTPTIDRDVLDITAPEVRSIYFIAEAVGFDTARHDQLIGAPLPFTATTAWRALERREPEFNDRLSADEWVPEHLADKQSALAAPIFYQAGVYGVLILFAPRLRAFDYDAVEFLRALTHQTAVGIGNAQRYAELEHLYRTQETKAEILNNVLEIGQALRADRSLENLLEQVAYSAVESANYRKALFCLTDPHQPRLLTPFAAAGIPRDVLASMKQLALDDRLVTLYLEPRFRLGRCYFIPAQEARAIESAFETNIFAYLQGDDEHLPSEWQTSDRLCVPLYATDGDLLGVMLVADPLDHRRPTERTVEPLAIFADQAAIAIENAWLLRDADARADEMTALFQVGTAATSTTDLDTLLNRVYTELTSFLGVPSFFFVASYHHETDDIYFNLFMQGNQLAYAMHKTVVPRSGLIELVLRNGEPLLIADLWAEPAYQAQAVHYADEAASIRSWLGIPLISQGRAVGLLCLQDVQPHAFAQPEVQFLSTVANQLAIAIERASLFDERERRLAELDVINQIGHVTSSTLDLRTMLEQVYDHLRSFLSLDSFFVFIYYEEENRITLSIEVDNEILTFDDHWRSPSPTSLTARIIQTRNPLLFHDLRQEEMDTNLNPITFGTDRLSASWLGVPLLVGESSVVGVIAVMSYSPGLYGPREQSFLTTVANQLALGVQNARLLEQAEAQVDQLQLVNQVSFMASAETDVQAIYQLVVDAMAQATRVDQARLVIYDREAGVAYAVAEHRASGILDQIRIPLRHSPSVDWLDQHREPLVALDAQHDPLFVLSHATFRELDIRSITLVPLVVAEQVIGAVGLDFVGRIGEFTPQAIKLCHTIANQTSTAISRAQAFAAASASAEALEQKVKDLSTVLDAAGILSSLLRPDEVLNKLMDLVSRSLGVATVALWIINGEDVLVPIAIAGIPSDQRQSMRVPVGEGMTGRVASTRKPLIIDNVELSGTSLYPNYQRENHLVSYMGVPVIYQGQTIGVLSVMTNAERHFSQDEQALLSGLADQAATALQTARLFQEREQNIHELSTINTISADVNATLQLDDLISHLHEGIGKVLDVRTSMVALYDVTNATLTCPLAYHQGLRVQPTSQMLRDAVNARVVQSHQSLLFTSRDDILAAGLLPEPFDPALVAYPVESLLVVPILFGNQPLGVINLQSDEPRAFTEGDERFLMTVANQAAAAINNARLFSEMTHNAEEMQTLLGVTRSLAGSLDLDETQRLIASGTLGLLNAELCAVLRLDAHGTIEQQVLVDASGLRDDLHIDFRFHGMTQMLLERNAPLAIADLQVLEDSNPDALRLGIRSVVGTAIGLHDQRLGVIWIGLYQPHEWSAQQISLLGILANQAGQALKSARLFEEISNLAADLEHRVKERTAEVELANQQLSEEKERLEAVHTITLELTTQLDTSIILRESLESISLNLGVTRGSIMLRDPETQVLICRAVLFGLGDARTANIPLSLGGGEGLAGWVMQSHESVNIPDVLQDPRWQQELGRADDARSAAAVPLQTSDQALGVIVLSSTQVNYFTDSQMNLLGTIASVVAAAISNAQLYGYINELANRNGLLLEAQREESSKRAAVFSSVSEGIIVLDPDQRITLFNPAAEQVVEVASDMVLGQPLSILEHLNTNDMAVQRRARAIFQALANGLKQVELHQQIYSTSIDLTDPTQFIAANLAPVIAPSGDHYGNVAVLRDVTGEIEADQAKRQFISDVSHELRTPLTAVKGYVDVLLLTATDSLNEDQIGFLQIIKNNTNRLRALIDDILEFSRPDSKRKLQISDIDIPSLIKEAVQSLLLEAEHKQMQVSLDVPDDLPLVMGDQRRISQVFFNLFSNAVKYTFEGGRIHVRAFLNPGGMLQIEVEDTGVGMTPAQLKKLFRPFYRADNPLRDITGGTGLGLAIAKQIVEQHGGEMWVPYSEPGRGSVFSFILPLEQPEAEQTDEDAT